MSNLNRQTGAVVLRILFVLIMTPLLGLGAQSHPVSRELRSAQHLQDQSMNLAASQHLGRAAQMLPSRPELWEQAGALALAGGDPQTAVEYFEQAASQGLSPGGQLQLGDAYLQTGNRDSAMQIWEYLANQPQQAQAALERLVSAYLEMGDYPGAIAALRSMAVLQPENAQIFYQLGLVLAAQDPEGALVYLTRAADLDPDYATRTRALQRGIGAAALDDDPAYKLMGAGRTLASLDEWAYAAEAFHQATLQRPDYAEAWAYLGEARQHLPRPDQSQPAGLTELQTALDLDPASLSANTFLALYWQRQGRYDQAQEAAQTAILLNPDNPVLHTQQGELLALQGDLEAAYQAYLLAVQLAPYDANYYNTLAAFSLTYDYHVVEIALPASRQALRLAPDDPDSLDWMGQVLMQLEDLVNAERFFTRSINRDPQYAPAHLHLGMLYILQNKNERAYEALLQTVSLAPDAAAGKQAQQLLESAIP